MGKQNWEFAYHDPKWVAAPYRSDREGNTKPGFLCIHELENGNGLCASTWFEESTSQHCCVVRLRGRWNISRPCYDKVRRCPGWAGGGWKSPKHSLCREGGYLPIDHNSRWWKWKTHTCPECKVVVLPYMFRYTSPRSCWYRIESTVGSMWYKVWRAGIRRGWW